MYARASSSGDPQERLAVLEAECERREKLGREAWEAAEAARRALPVSEVAERRMSLGAQLIERQGSRFSTERWGSL